ncbi:hypothetical protein PQX77_018749 [Marasmius sp. AFHP31]|nr:hypothetical protein PQX77_018749 [Marasmius sp. AFHP31]
MSPSLEQPRLPNHSTIQNYKSTPPSHIRLPPEVIWMIIEEVDLQSAYQCALAASCFLYPSRRRIFQKIRLFETEYDHVTSSVGDRFADFFGLQRKDLASRPNRCLQLLEILDSAVEIRSLVKELVIEGRTPKDTLNPISSWYSPHHSPLSPVLSRLHSLESISFLFPLSRPLLFRCLPLESAHAIIRTVQSPLLRTVVLENVLFEDTASDPTDLLHFIRACSLGGGLSDLAVSEHYTSVRAQDMRTAVLGQHQHDLHEVDIVDSFKWRLKDLLPPSAYSFRNEQLALTSLSVTGTGFLTRVFLDWALESGSPISLAKLRSLTLGGLSRNSIKRASHVVQRSSRTLQHLAFAQESYHNSPFPVSLPSTPPAPDDLIPLISTGTLIPSYARADSALCHGIDSSQLSIESRLRLHCA